LKNRRLTIAIQGYSCSFVILRIIAYQLRNCFEKRMHQDEKKTSVEIQNSFLLSLIIYFRFPQSSTTIIH